MPIYVNLSTDDIERAVRIASQRNDKPAHVDKSFDAKYEGEELHIMSALAEIAWEKYTGMPVDEEIKPGGDGGVDFEHKGKIYQIKARNTDRYKRPDLLCRTDKALADYYVLVDVSLENKHRAVIVGWCTHKQLIENEPKAFGHGKRYYVPREELRAFRGVR